MLTVVQLLYSIKTRDQRRDVTGDPWDGRTLEWLTLSPPPHYNFAVLPDVHGEEAYWTRKQTAIKQDQLIDEPDYQPIEMPVNTPTGVIVAFFASLCGFAVIWYIWWLAILGLIGAFAVFVWYAWRDEHEHIIPVEEVTAERARAPPHPHGAPPQAEPVDMSTAPKPPAIGLTHGGSEDTGLGHRGPESKSIVVPYGFWLFVLSDMVLFSALFATYATLVHATDGGPATQPAVRPQPGRGRDDGAAALELRLRPRDDRRQAQEHAVDAGLAAASPACSASSSCPSSSTSSPR